jgi:hypothetical protein
MPLGHAVIIGGSALVWLNFDVGSFSHELRKNGLIVGDYNLTSGPQLIQTDLTTSQYGTRVLNFSYSGTKIGIILNGPLNATYRTSNGPGLQDDVEAVGLGEQYVTESPSRSVVIQDNTSSSQRTVEYETRELRIVKQVVALSNVSTAIRFTANCNVPLCSRVVNATSYLWIPWSRYLVDYSVAGSMVEVGLDAAQFSLDFSPTPSKISVVNTPQPAVAANYEGGSQGNVTYTIAIQSKSGLSAAFQDSSRPRLNGSDLVSLDTNNWLLQLVFQDENIRIYRAIQR